MRARAVFALAACALGCGTKTAAAPQDAGPVCADASASASIASTSFFGVGADGTPKTVLLSDYFEPCAATKRLLVLRVVATWCGTCLWHAAHTSNLTNLDVAPRLRFLDVLVRNGDNDPAFPEDLPPWQAALDSKVDVAADTNFIAQEWVTNRSPLPFYVFFDTTTLAVVGTVANPGPEALEDAVHAAVASLDGAPLPPPTPVTLTDGRFTQDQWDMIGAMALTAPPPPDPSDAKADASAAAALGASLFTDTQLSPAGTIACASCHDPAHAFMDGLPVPTAGAAPGDRNTPSILLASYASWQMWDGRADTLWMQATLPLEGTEELASSRVYITRQIAARYADAYQALFGPLPDMTDYPAAGMPGDPAWEAMSFDDRTAVNTVFSNVAKAIEAYERTLRVPQVAIDQYAQGNAGALADAEKDGLAAYFQAGCAMCHYGPRLTDGAFHNLRFATGRADGAADQGRFVGITLYTSDEFRVDGPLSDAPPAAGRVVPEPWEWSLGSFKTPALRGAPDTAPYGHGGTLAALADVVALHRTGGLDPTSALSAGTPDSWLPSFDASMDAPIVTFVSTLHVLQ